MSWQWQVLSCDKLLLLQFQSQNESNSDCKISYHYFLNAEFKLTTFQYSSLIVYQDEKTMCTCVHVYSTRRGIACAYTEMTQSLDSRLWLWTWTPAPNFNRAAGSCESLLLPISFLSLTLLSLLHNIRGSIQRQPDVCTRLAGAHLYVKLKIGISS
jgi:hypothetical protein